MASSSPANQPSPASASDPASAAASRLWGRWMLALIGLQLALLLHGAWTVGPTYDEHFYISSGYAYLRDGEFALNREHPPLLKYLAGAPLLLLPGIDWPSTWADQLNFPVAFFYDRNGAQLDRNLFAARVPFCLLTAALTWVVFTAARKRFGPRAGFAASALLALNPNVLANGRLAALDMGSAALIFIAVVAFADALDQPTARRTLWAAVAFGLAELTKFTALLLVPAFLGLAALAAIRGRSARPLLLLARVILGGLTVFAAGYGFESLSANEAWGKAAYRVSSKAEAPTREVIESALRAELAQVDGVGNVDSLLGPVLGAGDTSRAIVAWRELTRRTEPEGLAAAAARALTALDGGPGDLRREAFAAVLEAPDALVPVETKLELLPQLADRELRQPDGSRLTGTEAWSEWYGAARYDDWDEQLFTQGWVERLTRGLLGDAVPIPLFTALRGVDYQLHHGDYGHGSYYRRNLIVPSTTFKDGVNPFPEYYTVVMGVKNPIAFLVAIVAGLALAFVFGRRAAARPWTLLDAAAFLAFPALSFYLFSTGNALMGVRYVLPVFPFLALLAGRLEALVPRLGIGLALVAALESLWIHPHSLMYFNAIAGGPVKGPEITVVSDDWGQDVRELGRWYARNREVVEAAGGLHYDPYTKAELSNLGFGNVVRPTGEPVQGFVAVNAINYYRSHPLYRWLIDYEPFMRIGWSIYVYDTRGGPPGADPGLK
ncbi:ArnT family glycosyltransferase [Engelhardtia mirabilis]|uniref:Glycosyltransferase RgtA/B/C/D-like domain-containing protein n=1 Tax=Engelhardtia mirabilis TaxID=2528011 RepID=A0A518BM13_9BACT|nr:hypothetical protein Pla133_31090 [Planctomycetes bacterium Pla133]QDV02344.1 hypothetical protein Pla86_31080 [Planctomycetes bacterium Pla86]